MKNIPALTVGLSLLLMQVGGVRSPISAQTGVPAGAGAKAGGRTTLFDGTSLKGWDTVGDANWELSDGAVQATRGNGYLVTPMAYGDFELVLEFWVTDDANSGIFIRCADPKDITPENCYEVNIYDQRPDPAYRTGGIVNVASPKSVVNAGGRWNIYEIIAKGPRLLVTLNGLRLVDVEHTGHASGRIALQYGAGTVKFKNVRITTL